MMLSSTMSIFFNKVEIYLLHQKFIKNIIYNFVKQMFLFFQFFMYGK